MIPKNILYVWVGDKEKPPKVLECIETWKKNMPDWNYIEINDKTFDFSNNKYCVEAYKNKKWAFVSDYLRLLALYKYGGVYLDTDVIVYKPLDKFLKWDFFTGFEQPHYPVTATLGASKENSLIKEMLDKYDTMTFKVEENWEDYITNTMVMSDVIGKYFDRDRTEYQEKDNMAIYPQEVFCNRLRTQNEESYTEHLMLGMWGL